jgi:MSHA biogenesis protein MshP
MAALFIVVTLAAIGVYLLTVATGQVAAASKDEQAARAYQAARAGIEWAAFQVLRNAEAPPAGAGDFGPTCKNSNAATQDLSLGALGGPGGGETFQAHVACARSAEAEAGATVEIYVIKATACNRNACPGSPDTTYVERELQLVLSK